MSESLFGDEAFKNEKAEEPWKRSETDTFLDLHLAGTHPREIAYKLQRNTKAIKRRIEMFTNNERDRAIRYEPRQRVSRQGQRMTENEKLIIKAHKERGVPIEATARLVQRKEDEINPDWKRQVQVKESAVFAPTLDLLLACRYAKLKWQKRLLNDDTIARLAHEEREYGGNAKLLDMMPESMPERISFLAVYLKAKIEDDEQLERDKDES